MLGFLGVSSGFKANVEGKLHFFVESFLVTFFERLRRAQEICETDGDKIYSRVLKEVMSSIPAAGAGYFISGIGRPGTVPAATALTKNLFSELATWLETDVFSGKVENRRFVDWAEPIPIDVLTEVCTGAAIEIVQVFERQIIEATGNSRLYRRAIKKLGDAAALRVVGSIMGDQVSSIPVSYGGIERAFLYGSSKGVMDAALQFQCLGKVVHPDEIYDSTFIHLEEGKVMSRSRNFNLESGCRLCFKDELSWIEDLPQDRKYILTDLGQLPEVGTYRYVLQNINVQEKASFLIKRMSDSQPAQKSDISSIVKEIFTILNETRTGESGGAGRGRPPGPGGGSGGPDDDGGGGPGGGSGGPDDDGGGGPGSGSGGPGYGGGGSGGSQGPDDDTSVTALSQEMKNTCLDSCGNEVSQPSFGRKHRSKLAINLDEEIKDIFKGVGKRGSQPVWFGVRDPVSLFTGRERELEDLHSKMQSSSKGLSLASRMLCVVGLGGTGKTQLARKYIKKYAKDHNENVIWINSGSKAKIVESFLELDRDHGLNFSTSATGKKIKPIEIIVKKVFSFFATNKSLFIFDNLDKVEDLSCFLPLDIQYQGNSYPHILITSRNRDWEREIKRLELQLMSYQDAVTFVKNGLDIEDESQEKIGILLEKLQYFPLAIQQAISYIRDRRLVDKFDIDDYLNQYVIDKKKLLGYILPSDINNEYFHTTLVTWKVTIDKIKGNQEYGRLALDVLHVISYLGSDDIPVELFLNLAEKDDSKLKFSIRMLVASSMVDVIQEKNSLSVHRLVQETTRLVLAELGKSKKVIKKTFGLLRGFLLDSVGIDEVYGRKKQFLKHSAELLSHMGDWLVKESGEKKTVKEDYLLLLKLMANFHPNCCDLARQKELYKNTLPILIQLCGPKSLEVAEVQEILAGIYEIFGEYEKQKKYLQKCLFVFKMFYESDTPKVAEIMKKLAIACEDLGHNEEQEEYIKEVLPTLIRIHGSEHIEVAEMQESLAAAYECLGNHKEQKECLERLLPVFEKVPGYSDKVTEVLEKLAQTSILLGDMQGEQKYLERLLHHVMEVDHNKVPRLAEIVRKLASSHRDSGNYDEYMYYLEELFRYFITIFSYDSHEVANLLVEIAKAHYLVCDDEGSQEYFLGAFFIFKKIACSDNLDNSALARAIIDAFSHELIRLSRVYKSCSNPKEGFDRIVDMLNNGKLDLLVDILSESQMQDNQEDLSEVNTIKTKRGSASLGPADVLDVVSIEYFKKAKLNLG